MLHEFPQKRAMTRTDSQSNGTKATRLLGVDACVAVAAGLRMMMSFSLKMILIIE
jgi:hypothetical protein